MEIKSVAEKIRLNEDVKIHILEEGKKIAHMQKKREKARNKILAAAGVCIVMINAFLFTYEPSREIFYPITVFAQEASGFEKIEICEDALFTVVKSRTPFGTGYELKVNVEDGYRYTVMLEPEEGKMGLDTVIPGKDCIYWLPDGVEGDKTGVNVTDKTNISKKTGENNRQITFCVYDRKETLRLQMTVELREEDGQCRGKMTELYSYPEKR